MRKFLVGLTAVLITLCTGYGSAHAYAKGDQDCSKCHTLSNDQAKEALNGLIPGIKILSVQTAQVNGLWEIGMDAGGKKGVIYLDFSKKKILLGNLVDIKTRTNYTQEIFSKINTVDFSLLPLDNALVMGDKNAKHKIAVFDDPD